MDISSINSNAYNSINISKKAKIEEKSFENVLNNAVEKENEEELREACREFEQYFVNQLFKEMRNTVHSGGLIPKSQGEKLFEEMLDDEYAKEISKGNGIGISDMMYKQLSKKTP